MKTNENRSAAVDNLSLQRLDPPPSWALPSHCKRPPLKSALKLDLFDRLLTLLGLL